MAQVIAPNILQNYLQGLQTVQAVKNYQDDQQTGELYKQAFAKTGDMGKAMHSVAESLFQHGLISQGVAAASQAEKLDFTHAKMASMFADVLNKQETLAETKAKDAAQAQHWSDMSSALQQHYANEGKHWDEMYQEAQQKNLLAQFGVQIKDKTSQARITYLQGKLKAMLGELAVQQQKEARLSNKDINLNRQAAMAYRAAYPFGTSDPHAPNFFTFAGKYKDYVNGKLTPGTAKAPQDKSILDKLSGMAEGLFGSSTPAQPTTDYSNLWNDNTGGVPNSALPGPGM